MRIVIDLQGAQSDSRFRGIGRYTLSFTKALIETSNSDFDHKHEFHLVLNGALIDSVENIRETFRRVIPQEQIHLWYPVIPSSERQSSNTWRRCTNELIREAYIQKLRPDLVHISSFFEGYVDNAVTSISEFGLVTAPISLLFYDLIPLAQPKQYLDPEPRFKEFYERKIKQLKKADILLGISDFSCQQAIELLGVSPSKVVNISAASDLQMPKEHADIHLDQDRLIALKVSAPYIFYAGGGDARKNIRGLIDAFLSLPTEIQKSHQLVLAGHNIILNHHTHGLNTQALQLALKSKKILVTEYIDDEDLICLYRNCSVFVFPSFAEGFGLPPLEAMSFGAPVIAANTTSLPEVIGLEDALFDPLSIPCIVNKIVLALNDSEFRTRLIQHGLEQAKKFTWENSAKLTLEVFKQLSIAKVYPPLTHLTENTLSKYLYQQLIGKISAIPTSKGKPSQADLLNCAQAIAQSFPQQKTMPRLFVDISELAQRDARTGIQRVTRSILTELLDHPPEGYQVEPVYGTIDLPGYRNASQFIAGLTSKPNLNLIDDFIEPSSGDIFLGLDLQHHTTRVQSKFLAQMRRDGVFVCFVVYDLLPIHFPNFWPAKNFVQQVHEEWLRVICQSDAAICISKAVSDELNSWVMENKIPHPRNFTSSWFHLGADLNAFPTRGIPENAEDIITKLKSRPSFLLVGTLEPRKSYPQVLAAFNALWQEGLEINLIIVGKNGWMVDDLLREITQHPELDSQFFWLESVSDEFLELIYANSSCLIAASHGEGFGLPLIEAAQHHLPIIARNLSVFKEVAGDSAFYFDGFNAADLAQAIIKWLSLYEKNLHPKSDSLQWQTWHDSAGQLWDRICELKK